MTRRNHSRRPEPGAVFSLTRRGAACVVSGLLATGVVLTVPVAIVSCKTEMAPLPEHRACASRRAAAAGNDRGAVGSAATARASTPTLGAAPAGRGVASG